MGRIVIDEQKCKGCLLCVNVCPKKMISQGSKMNKNGYYTIIFDQDKDECIGCAICAQRCPDMAIKEVYK